MDFAFQQELRRAIDRAGQIEAGLESTIVSLHRKPGRAPVPQVTGENVPYDETRTAASSTQNYAGVYC